MNVTIKTETEELFNDNFTGEPTPEQREKLNTHLGRQIVTGLFEFNEQVSIDVLLKSEINEAVKKITLYVK